MAGERVLLVEDNDAVALGLQFGLEQQGFQLDRVDTVKSAREKVQFPRFDLAILDVRLPDGSGFDLCRDFRNDGLRQPIIMLTARDDVVDKIVGLEMGADDYVTKPFELQELVARIRALLRRSFGSLSEDQLQIISVGDISIHLDSQRVYRRDLKINLTPIEFRLLVYLAQNSGRTIQRERISKALWGSVKPALDARTIDVHIRNLRRKVEPDPTNPKMISTIRGLGYRFNRP